MSARVLAVPATAVAVACHATAVAGGIPHFQ